MIWTHRVLKFGTLALLTAAVTGCIVLPYGARHGGHGRGGGGYHAAPAGGQPIMVETPQQHPRGR